MVLTQKKKTNCILRRRSGKLLIIMVKSGLLTDITWPGNYSFTEKVPAGWKV